MPSRRVLKAAEAIREVVSLAILTEIRDPRIQNVTVTYVEVAADMRTAKVHVSVMGDEREQNLCLHGLESSAGFLQQRVANRIDTRYTPRLRFVLDDGVKKSIEVARILAQLQPAADAPEPPDDPLETPSAQPQQEPLATHDERPGEPPPPPDTPRP